MRLNCIPNRYTGQAESGTISIQLKFVDTLYYTVNDCKSATRRSDSRRREKRKRRRKRKRVGGGGGGGEEEEEEERKKRKRRRRTKHLYYRLCNNINI